MTKPKTRKVRADGEIIDVNVIVVDGGECIDAKYLISKW